MRAAARRAAVVLALLGGALAAASLAGPAAAAPSAPAATGSPCTNAQDITVVVDQQSLGGGVKVGCAAQPVKSGFEALEKAGFQVTRVQRFPGALCKIDDKPAMSCNDMPPADSFWSYWIASRGGDWCFSNQGANRKLPTGTVEGWSFSTGGESASPQPRYAPPEPVAGTTPNTLGRASCPSEPTTTTTARPVTPTTAPGGGTPTTAGTPESTTTVRPGGGSGTTAPGVDGTTTTGDAAATDDGSSSSSTAASEGGAVGDRGDDGPAGDDLTVDERDDGGSPVGVALGVGGAALLGGAAIVTARRRRQADELDALGPLDEPTDPTEP